MNTVIACGGTGGHLFPGLAVAEVLRSRGHEVMLFVSEKEIDTLALSGREEFSFQKLPTVGLPSPFSPKILGFLGRFSESPAHHTYRVVPAQPKYEWRAGPQPFAHLKRSAAHVVRIE